MPPAAAAAAEASSCFSVVGVPFDLFLWPFFLRGCALAASGGGTCDSCLNWRRFTSRAMGFCSGRWSLSLPERSRTNSSSPSDSTCSSTLAIGALSDSRALSCRLNSGGPTDTEQHNLLLQLANCIPNAKLGSKPLLSKTKLFYIVLYYIIIYTYYELSIRISMEGRVFWKSYHFSKTTYSFTSNSFTSI